MAKEFLGFRQVRNEVDFNTLQNSSVKVPPVPERGLQTFGLRASIVAKPAILEGSRLQTWQGRENLRRRMQMKISPMRTAVMTAKDTTLTASRFITATTLPSTDSVP